MSTLSDALTRVAASKGSSTVRGGAGSGAGLRGAQVGLDGSYAANSAKWGSLMNFAQVGLQAVEQYDTYAKKRGEERSNEIIRSLTPEQRRQAVSNGTLLYQDDPYAMEALNTKTGRNAAFLIDDDVQQAIARGQFRTRQEMEQYRHSKMQEGMQSYAESFGIDINNEYFRKGFDSDITERNISLYGAHDKFLSEQAQKGAMLNTKVELNGVLNDPNALASPRSAEFFTKYIDNSLKMGSIPSDGDAAQVITGSLNDVVQRPNATNFLNGLADQKVTLNGTTTTYKQLMGDEQWNALLTKAQHSQFQNDAKLTETFRLNIGSATNQADTVKGWEMLQGMKAELDKRQPSDLMTPEREMLIQAMEGMQSRFRQESAATAKETDKQQKSLNKQQVIERQFDKRLNGQWVSTDYKDMPTNESTGEFTHSDMVNFANKKLAQIDAMQISDEQKDRLKLAYLRVDNKEGAFRTAIGTMVTDAGSEWQAAVINGTLSDNSPALNGLRKIRNADPNLIAALYPDKAELFLTMDMMDKQGIDPQVLIDSDRSRRTLTKEQQVEDSKAWQALKNNSNSDELKYIPASLDDTAKRIYESVKYRTGNSDMAMQQVDTFLKESTTTLTSNDAQGDTIGIIPKNMLTVTDDPKSWEQGRDILDAARKGIIEANPWVTNKQLSVYQQGDSIYLMDTTGQIRIRYDQQLLAREYSHTQQKLAEEAERKALEEATKRAPIGGVNKVSREISEGKRKGVAQRSQEFREQRLNRKQ